ncbi:B2 bradykinin receptor-like [Parambassis ranga]|uniref:B2 bradykinin receptor-like n=1 Tax=Parambassis ranga TaxID=210632 RepID=A0A6P7KLG9_9TELE|nr:B2 bradykinin receptor-like [Parambassis ranga]XP_028289172.1 B2 bradykinin receptor-like [Parambassis ranga]
MTLSPTSMSANLSNETAYQNETQCFGDISLNFMMGVSFLSISVLGIILNLFVLVVFCFHKKACTVPEIYLSNLAAADFLLMICFPFTVLISSNKYLSSAKCKLIYTIINMNTSCSSGFLALVSIDRYLALVNPLSHERLRRPICAKLGCVLVWTLGFLLNVDVIFYFKAVHDPEKNITECDSFYPSRSHVMLSYILYSTFSFFLPLCIMFFCTVNILHVLRNRVTESSSTQKMEHRATTLVLAVLLVFVICWLPDQIATILYLILLYIPQVKCHGKFFETIREFSFFLGIFNSVLNPILYIFFGKTFHKKIKEFFQQCRALTTSTTLTSTCATQTSNS